MCKIKNGRITIEPMYYAGNVFFVTCVYQLRKFWFPKLIVKKSFTSLEEANEWADKMIKG